jgi:SPP1 gp7 family putative phage head morphogenesis protein
MPLPPRKGRTGRTRRQPSTAGHNAKRIIELRTAPTAQVPLSPLPTSAWSGYAKDLRAVAKGATDIMRRTVLAAVERQANLASQYTDREGEEEEQAPETEAKRAAAQERPSLRVGVQLTLPFAIQQAQAQFTREVEQYTIGVNIPKILGPAGERINVTNQKAQVRISNSLGLRAVQPGTQLAAAAKAWTDTNAALIVSQPAEVAARVQALVAEMVPAGARWETIAKRLVEEEGIAQRRANLIARDQTSKYNADLTRIRQTGCGITHYEWRGTMDARERPSHVALQGMVFAWDKPPIIGHPGEPIQCRCQAIPVTSSRGIAKEAALTEAELVNKVAALGPTQRQGPNATPAEVRTRAKAEVAGDIRLANRRETVRAETKGP